MNWKNRIYESLKEAKKPGTRAVAKKAAMTDPRKRTPKQQRAYEKAREKYQATGETPFRSGRAMSREQRLKDAGLGGPPREKKKKTRTRASKKTRGVASHGKKRISEVSLDYAAKAAGRARVSRKGTARNERDIWGGRSDTEEQIARVKGKLKKREVAKRGTGRAQEYREYRTTDKQMKPGATGQRYSVDYRLKDKPKGGGGFEGTRSLYSGGRKETTGETVSRKFDKAARKAEKK